jgi:hypothetical protein
MGAKWITRKDNDFGLAWIKNHEKGRVFNTSFGHRTEIYYDSRILRFYLDAVQFATGDLDAPVDPIPAPKREIPGTTPVPDLPGFVSLFNGKDLAGWSGDEKVWSVQDDAITGISSAQNKVAENTFLFWKDEIEDFELRCKFRLEGGNSGIYFRAKKRPANVTKGEALVGMQADFSADGNWTGVVMEYTMRDILAQRGERVSIDKSGTKKAAAFADAAKLLEPIRIDQWNDYHITATGGKIMLKINGQAMCEIDDADPKRLSRGWLGLQVHTGPPMKVQFKDIYLKRL